MKYCCTILFCLYTLLGFAQSKTATVNGLIVDENDKPLANISISMLGKNTGIVSSDSGRFNLKVPAQKAFALLFSATGYTSQQKNFYLSANEVETVTIRLMLTGATLDEVIITDDKSRTEPGLIKINPKNSIQMPSTTGGVEAMIKVLVGSNNELSSQYNVRGGNYDENLIYINDFEVFRPYLVSNGQQEGLSLINPELAKNVNFYTGGFAAKYGDKISSVLDIQYKKPTSFSGSAYMSLLEQGLQLEGAAKKGAITWQAAVRNKNNRNLLSSQPTLGAYIPSASDAQTYITYQINPKWQLELLGIYSTSKFTYFPEAVKKTSSVFSPLFTANLGLDIFFEGQERDRYNTSLLGASIINNPNKKLQLKWMISRFKDKEIENFDIAGAYIFGDRDFDNTSTTFGEIINPLGAGYYQNYARNELNIDVYNASHKGSYSSGKHFLQWGSSIEQTNITDQLRQFEYRDSAGFSLPYSPTNLVLYSAQNSTADLSIQKLSGYVQDNINISKGNNNITLQGGVRYNYNSLNKELLVSPRVQASLKPSWKRDVLFKFAAGLYHQPPFYRELRRYDGTLNTEIKAQRSSQIVAGMDYSFKGLGNRPFRLTTEAYYKQMTSVVPYDIDNVKIRYLGENNARAYATGLEFRLFGELVKDAESWLSIGFMRTRENLDNDFYYQYKNAAGEVINANTQDQVVSDSVQTFVDWLRRPSDRLITVGLYLEDYLATNKNFKVHFNMIYGSNMPYNIPNSVRYRNGLIVDPYIRVDVGFSALLLSEKSTRRSHNPFRGLDNIWASVEVFNLIDRANTISYQIIKDFANNSFAIPNRLTPRLLNVKLLARF
jgi:hypothetical protein